MLLGILEPTETILLSTHLLEECALHQPGGAPPVGADRRGTTAALESAGQSLMDYVRSACGYEARPGAPGAGADGQRGGIAMRKSLLLFVLLAALSAGLLAGPAPPCRAAGGGVLPAEILAGDPAAADGVELTWVSTCGYHLFWHSTFPAAAPEEAETRFSYSGQRQSWIIELDEDVLELSRPEFLDIARTVPPPGCGRCGRSSPPRPPPCPETRPIPNTMVSSVLNVRSNWPII